MQAPELRPLGVGEILTVAFKLWLRNFATLFTAVAVVVIPLGILATLVILTGLPENIRLSDGQIFVGTDDDVARVGVALLAGGIIQALGSLVATGAAFKALADAYLGAKPSAAGSLRFAGRRLPALVWLAILTVVVVVGGLVLLIIPGIYVLVALSVVIPARLLEDLPGLKALKRSRDLVKGRWWPTAGVFLIGFVLIPVLLGVILESILGSPVVETAGTVSTHFMLTQLVGIASALVTTPLQAAVATVLYFDLRVRKEGFDHEVLARDLGGPQPAETPPLPSSSLGPESPTPGPTPGGPPEPRG